MRILAYEFITGGGLAREPLPPSLAHEGDAMLAALLADLCEIESVTAVTTRDDRCPPLAAPVEVVAPLPGEAPLAHFERALAVADAVWPVAPETGGMLEVLLRTARNHGKIVLGCRPGAARIAASKSQTSRWLHEHGIAVVPTYEQAQALPFLSGAGVVKPDDGAGCADTVRIGDWTDVRARLTAAGPGFVAQPWIDGEAMSLSLLCADGQARVLSCNRQQMVERNGILALDGVAVGAAPADRTLRELASAVAAALPGLWGYVGIDFVDTPRGPVVIEINPRLTTSYCGLHAAIGENPAQMVLALLGHGRQAMAGAYPGHTAAIKDHDRGEVRNVA